MKNKSNSKIATTIARIFNFSRWFDWERTKSSTLYLTDGIKKFLIPQKHTATESFKAAQKRLELTDSDIIKRQEGLLRLCILMLLFSFSMFFYTIYLLYYFQIKAFIVSFVVMMLGLTLAFRYHFWYFQIEHRKLGCSVKEWFKTSFTGGGR